MAVARSTSGVGALGYTPALFARPRVAVLPRYRGSFPKMFTHVEVRASKGRRVVESKEQANTVQLPFGLQFDKTDAKAKATLTTYIPSFIVLCIAMYLDAAFSGDWSRIGVITEEQEQVLKSFFVISVSIHGMLGLAEGAISLKRGEKNFIKRAIKTFVVGIVGFAEVWYLGEDELASDQ